MKNAMSKLCSAMLVLGVVGCGGAAVEGENEDGLSASKQTHVSVRRDERKCASPACGGYYVRDANKATAEQYVASLDFSASGLDDATVAKVTSAPAGELVLLGKLTAADSKTRLRSFKVSSAFRGMPGFSAPAGDSVYSVSLTNIQCVAAPCLNKVATRINDGVATWFSGFDVGAASAGFVDQGWLVSRVRDHGALVAAQVVDGVKLSAGHDQVLAAAQVFVKLPETASCAPSGTGAAYVCPADQVAVFQRDENRCLKAVGCSKPGVCSQAVPSCAAGYTLVQWRAGANGCLASACDPTFSR